MCGGGGLCLSSNGGRLRILYHKQVLNKGVVFRKIAGSDWSLRLGVSWGNVFTFGFILITVFE